QTVLDPVVNALRSAFSGGGAVPPRVRPESPRMGPGPVPPGLRDGPSAPMSGYPRSGASQPAPAGAPLPDRLPPLVGPTGQQPPPAQQTPWVPDQPGPGPLPQAGTSPWSLEPEANLPDWLRNINEGEDPGTNY